MKEETLGKALKNLKEKGFVLDEDMELILKSIYKYACNAGIRHGSADPVAATEEDAVFIMVISAAGINYLNALRQM